MNERLKNRIVVNPDVMTGKPVIKGTRIAVDAIVRRLAEGMTVKELLEEYTDLNKDDVRAALEYCADVISNEDVVPVLSKAR